MNCKPGDLAIVVRSTLEPAWIGRIVKCVELVEYASLPHWRIDGHPANKFGGEIVFSDQTLRPIRPEPGEDETLQWAPLPGLRLKDPA